MRMQTQLRTRALGRGARYRSTDAQPPIHKKVLHVAVQPSTDAVSIGLCVTE
jgi:hypothetical protein